MNTQNYKHCTPIQIRFSDLDPLKHVNNACYLNYCETGRVSYFTDVFKNEIDWIEKGFILARTEMDHLEPLFLNDELHCYTRISKIGTKSITVKNILVKKVADKQIECAHAIGILVAMNYRTQESIELPTAWVELIRKFEGNTLE